jgi:hypothetical protein
MPQQKSIFLTLSALALCMAQPALALTAEELWAEWQSQSAVMGQIVTAEQVIPGTGTLTLTGYSSTFSDPDVSTVARLDQVVMTETGDGSVIITMSDTYAVTISFSPDMGSTPITAVFNVIMPGLSITASGTVDARIYEYEAPRITVEDGPVTGGDGPLPVIDLMIGVEDFAAIYQMNGADPTNISYDSTSSTSGITGALDLTPPPGEPGRLKMNFAMGASTGSGAGSFGNLAAIATNPDVFPTGLAFAGDFSYDSARLEMTFEHPSDAFTLLTSNQGGSLQARFSETEMGYRMAATGSTTYFLGPDLPVPVEVSMASSAFGFSVPLAKSDAPQPVSARLAYQDVVLSPEIWGMIDPAQAIPRDPISVIADVAGSVRVLANLFSTDPAEIATMPGELVDLSLNELRIAVAGAELTGTGSATFAPGPMPMPIGSVDLQLRGANALLDRLQNSGLVPIEQLAMARGLMGAFTRPGAEPDTVQTTIQFTEGGGISANGVPLQ